MVAGHLGEIVRPLERVSDLGQFTLSVVAQTEAAGDLNKGQALTRRPQFGVDAGSIARRAVGEARDWSGDVRQPRRCGRTGILYQTGGLGMLEGTLSLAIVVEAEFIHRTIADGPGVRNIPLLKTLCDLAAKARNIGARQLKVSEGLGSGIVGEVVISAEVLL